jgi:hypothetical protein
MSVFISIALGVQVLIFCTFCANVYYLASSQKRRVKPDVYPSLSVIIPARNEAENLRRLLPSLLMQDYPHFEVVVYDDGSEDGTGDVVRSFDDPCVRCLTGTGLPNDWLGKPHALYQATRHLDTDVLLFLDADVCLLHPQALKSWVERYVVLPSPSFMTGLPQYRGGGLVFVSQISFMVLGGLPLILMHRLRFKILSLLNGQFWMIRRELYQQYEPHQALKDAILEDVEIGRYLKGKGVMPYMMDIRRDLDVWMYNDFRSAWHGFTKNAYLIMGGNPILATGFMLLFAGLCIIAPFCSIWVMGLLYLNKCVMDRYEHTPWWISALTPLIFMLTLALQIYSTFAHWTKRVLWKGRKVT